MYCRFCGKSLPDGTRSCPSCGGDLTVTTNAPEGTSQPAAQVLGKPPRGNRAVPPKPVWKGGRTHGMATKTRRGRPAPKHAAPGKPITRRASIAAFGAIAGVVTGAIVTSRLGLWSRDGSSASATEEAQTDAGAESINEKTLAFGSRELVPVSLYTHIVPMSTESDILRSYTVRVRSAVDAAGADLDVYDLGTATVVEKNDDVTDDGAGLQLESFGELEDGTWELTVTPDGEDPCWLPPLQLVSQDEASALADGGDSGEGAASQPLDYLYVMPASQLAGEDAGSSFVEEVPLRLGKWGSFYQVVLDAQGSHGEAGYGDDGSGKWMRGLSMAFSEDFGDGVRRLVLAYPYAASWDGSGLDSNYVVEVWEYDADEDTSRCRATYVTANVDGLNEVVLTPGSGGSCLVNGNSDVGLDIYGLADDGGFGLLCYSVATSGDEGEFAYYVGDTAVTESVFNNKLSELGYATGRSAWTCRALSVPYGDDDSLTDALDNLEYVHDEVGRTLDELETLAGDLVTAREGDVS